MLYGEKDPFIIVTSPCYVNQGNNTNIRAQELLIPLNKKFKDKLATFNSTTFTTDTAQLK